MEYQLLKREKNEAARRYAEARNKYEREPGRSVGKYGYDLLKRDLDAARREKSEKLAAFVAKEKYLKRLLDEGATIEAGVFTLSVERRRRAGVMSPVEYEQLKVC
jgi:hypothetical protein